jgi:trans-aconitate 2-methyltransferase
LQGSSSDYFGLCWIDTCLVDQSPSISREWNSSVYHRLSGPQVSWGKKVLARLRLRGDEVVLDAGCGTGRLTAELMYALPMGRVVGIDLSQNMLSGAREHLWPRFDLRAGLVAADLLHLPFERAFDGIVSTAAFHWVLDHDRLFLELRRTLRPGGWLEGQCGGVANVAILRKRAMEEASTREFSAFFEGFSEPWFYADAEGAACTLRRAGFVDVVTSLEPAPTVLQNGQQYSEFVSNIILRQHLKRIPDEDLRALFMARLTEEAEADDPPFSLDYWRLNLTARNPS